MMKRVLMCRPTYFDVEYIINPWMKPGTINRSLALKQWNHLLKTYQKLGIKVDIIEPQPYLPDMVFAADQGVVFNNTVVLSNFKHLERQGERIHYLKWFEEHDFNVQVIPEGYYFEGQGECLFQNSQRLFVGTGFRSTKVGAHKLGEILQVESIALELVNPDFYHLDTCFFILNESTAFYYPQAFSAESQQLLKKMIRDLHEFTKSEVYGFAANNTVYGRQLITQKGNNTFIQKLKKLAYIPIEVDVSEFIKAGGGIHCVTNVLK